jgi:protein-disulfide isomerase
MLFGFFRGLADMYGCVFAMKPTLTRLFARVAACLLVLHLVFFWAAESSGTFLGFGPIHYQWSSVLFFLIAVYFLLDSHFTQRETEIVEEEIVSVTEEHVGRMQAASSADAAWKNPYIVSAVIIGAALIVAGVLIAGPKGSSNKTADGVVAGSTLPSTSGQPSAPQASQAPKVAVTWGDTPILNKNAKVQLIQFSDFECPYCGKFYTETFGQIKTNYIDTGKIAFEHRDYPLPFHANAEKAAEAARCALEQSDAKYWSIEEWMYKNQTTLDIATLKNTAKTLGLNTSKFNTCLDTGKYAAAVKKDSDAGTGYGVQGTPSFFINGELFVGAQPFSAFQQKLDAALAAAK